MLSIIENVGYRALDAYCRVRNACANFKSEHGQTTAEYVAVTAVAVALAVGVIFAVLGGSLNTAIDNIASWIGETAPADPPDPAG